MRIDEIDAAEVPAGIAQMKVRGIPILGGDLEALPPEADGAIGTALAALDLDAEGRAQRIAPWRLACDGGTCEIPLERRRADLAVLSAVMILGDPRLGSEVELIERGVGFSLGHREQPSFDPRPERT